VFRTSLHPHARTDTHAEVFNWDFIESIQAEPTPFQVFLPTRGLGSALCSFVSCYRLGLPLGEREPLRGGT
jgi:hypothetical protein